MIPESMRHLLPRIVEEIVQVTVELRADVAKEQDRIRRAARLSMVHHFFLRAAWLGPIFLGGASVHEIILDNLSVLAPVLEGEEDFKNFVTLWWEYQMVGDPYPLGLTLVGEWTALAEAMKLDVPRMTAFCHEELARIRLSSGYPFFGDGELMDFEKELLS